MPDDYRNTSDDRSAPLGVVGVGVVARSGVAEDRLDRDIFRVTLRAGETYRFDLFGEASGGGTLADPFLTLRGSDGAVLLSDDDSGFGLDSQITYTALTSGIAYLEAQSYGDSAGGTYSLLAVEIDDYRDAFNDPTAPLGAIPLSTPQSGNLERGGDTDVFRINLYAGETYRFSLRGSDGGGGSLGDPLLTLRDANGAAVRTDDDGGVGFDSEMLFTASATGVYFLQAGAFEGDATGTYTLQAVNLDDYRDAFNDPSGPLGSVVVGAANSRPGRVNTLGDHDVFRVVLQAGYTYQFDMTGADSGGATLADPFLQLRDATGAVVAFDSDNGTNLEARIVYTATAAGTYYLDASEAGNDALGTFRLRASLVDDYRDTIGDTTSPLGSLAIGGPARSGVIEIDGDYDQFRVRVEGGETYRFVMSGEYGGGGSLTSPELVLRDGAGGLLAYDDGIGGTEDAQFLFTATANATVYLEARSRATVPTGSYTVQAVEQDDFRDTYNDRTASLGALAVNGAAVAGAIQYAQDADVFSVTLEAGVAYRFGVRAFDSGQGSLDDPIVSLFGANGALLATDDDSGAGVEPQLNYVAQVSGTHYVAVSAFEATDRGTYVVDAVLG